MRIAGLTLFRNSRTTDSLRRGQRASAAPSWGRAFAACALFAVTAVSAQQKYTGPRPEKADLPYLLHATKLIPTDAAEAKEEKRKEGTAYITAGAAAQAKTPLAEPIFLFESKAITPDKLTMYKLEVKNGAREVFFFDNPKKRKESTKPIRISAKKLDTGLYRLEPTEPLVNGEYVLTPSDSNTVFAFTIY
jgi:hypothetical protein